MVLSPLAVIAGSAESSVQPLYPQLAGLGSLDLSSFPPPALAVLENFCTAFTSGATTTSFMTADSKYLLALFYHDVEQLLAPLKSTGAQTEKAAPEEAAEEAADFTSWRCGRPFVSADFLQVPVQFTGAYGSLLTFVYINREKDAWKIDQLQIRKWEAENDTK